ncbi:PH domain-containing protein [Streptomyces nodosus]|uniref:AmphORF3 n=1 Tax=Streptomyces nodosus TaxID=40318 RepID=Q93NX3_9ACTN|nr:PH domain-containing protein [Streptomyces nodosus]AAK73507.1 AmphORF3 [Streptomyces nodosus]AJE39055.1 membrane protein [Streptomyces nodosus]MBB4789916.1 hypothetical protein [Streptomyces nodosus]QEV37646.1 PH domain-containing protein [Streptomyces nodosus]
MNDAGEVVCRPSSKRPLWFFVGLGAAGALLAAGRAAFGGGFLDVGVGVGLLLALVGIAALHAVTAQVRADAYGLHSRTLLRRRSVPWRDVADLRVRLKYIKNGGKSRRVGLVLRDGHRRHLPLPTSVKSHDPDFDAKLEGLRALHRHYGTPESSHIAVVSPGTAGAGWVGSLIACALLLVSAGVAAVFVPSAGSHMREWKSATPCTAESPVTERGECLTTLPAVIARTDAHQPKQPSWLYFMDGRPVKRVRVSYEAAEEFQSGDNVELTFWHGQVMKVAGEGHVWREHIAGAGDVAVVAAVLTLAAGYPAARVLLRLRGRRLPDDEVLPSELPFAGALVGTALWLLPLCYVHPLSLLDSPVAMTWAAAGSLVSLGLFGWAWHATRIIVPGAIGAIGAIGASEASAGKAGEEASTKKAGEGEEEVFLVARFLEDTDYNPYGFGTHIALGGGTLAVTPGPGRYGAHRIPVERLIVKGVRRARGGDDDTVPASWHIAELDDAGTTVRLAAAPADLARIIRALDSAEASVNSADPKP